MRLGHSHEPALAEFVARHCGPSPIDLDAVVDPNVLKLVPSELCEQHRAIPVRRVDNHLIVAMVDPANLHALDALRFLTQFDIVPVLVSEAALKSALLRYYSRARPVLMAMLSAPVVEAEPGADAPIVRLMNAILLSAIKKRARLVSIARSRVWFCCDAHWTVELEIPVDIYPSLFRRLCIMLGSLAPARNAAFAAPLTLQIDDDQICRFVVDVEHAEDGLRALVEQLSEDEFECRRSAGQLAPHVPAGQPIPGWTAVPEPLRE